MINITTGNLMHIYGSFAEKVDYTGRVTVRMYDPVDAGILARALDKTRQRYPYFSLQIRKNESEYYFEENPRPVTLHNTNGRIRLSAAETNYHLWAVCYYDDYIHLDTFHGMTDGIGMYHLLSTLLFYYCNERYGVEDSSGIRVLTDPVSPEETADPQDALPDVDLSQVEVSPWKEAFTLETDGGLTPAAPTLWDVVIPEEAFMRFTEANDSSPGNIVSLLFARAIDALYPAADKDIISAYVINARPMLNARESSQNCLGMALFDYEKRIKDKPMPVQCTIYRGKTFVQSDRDIVRSSVAISASRMRQVAKSSPGLSAKKESFGKMFSAGEGYISFLVSYVGKWPYTVLGKYIKEFWTHAPNTFSLMAEIAAVNGNFFISIQQRFREDCVREAFLDQLRENGIPCEVLRVVDCDIAYITEP